MITFQLSISLLKALSLTPFFPERILVMSSVNLQRYLFYPFVLFMFLSMIFCGVSRVNILFHITLALFIITMIINSETRTRFINDRDFLPALGMTGAFLLYFSLSNLWAESSHLSSAISHSFYLFSCAFIVSVSYRKEKNTSLAQPISVSWH